MNNNLQPLPPPHSVCEDCNSDDQLILHNIIRTPKSPPQKLCTSCVLQHYHKSICAQCFELYDVNSLNPPPLTAAATTTGNNRLLSCMRCDNWSHPGCLRPHIPRTPYICPPCRLSPNYKYFDCRKPRKNDQSQENGGGKCSAIDKDASKQLLGAARIAAVTVAKAAATARMEAERRAKEAALARKRAREAIDHVVAVAVKVENVKRREISTATGLKSVNCVPVTLEKDGGCNVGDVDVENMVGRENERVNGATVTVPAPMPVVMPPQQQDNHKNNGISVGNGVAGSGSGKDDSNAMQPQTK
ncbi:hypothetical protein RND81_12G160900 [Saponaria officinalis]|uniref:Zinc finger PHD-type domain-containing protein n=1 Tax=Saponaria officinalis TaxID=3572 RepID=A0AAW1HBC2_SAPOF